MGIGRRILGYSSVELQEELARVLGDPAGRLSRGDVRIGPCQFVLPMLVLLLGLLVFLGLAWLFGMPPIALAALAAVPSLIIGYYALRSFPRREVVLKEDGVEFRAGKQIVWCPWSLFDAAGTPHVFDTFQLTTMTLPVNPAAVPEVKLLKAGSTWATGFQVRTGPFCFPSPTQAAIFNGTELETTTLAAVLMALGRRLGPQRPGHNGAGEPLREKANSESAPGGAWVTLDVTRIVFPSVCCGCGAEPDGMLELNPRSLGGVLLTALSLGHFHITWLNVFVPICQPCRKLKTLRATVWYAVLALGLLGTLFLAFVGDNEWNRIPLLAFFILLLVGGPQSSLLVDYLASPVRVAWHDRRRNALRLKFRWPEYAGLVRQLQTGALVGETTEHTLGETS